MLSNAAGAPAGSYAHRLADRLITDFPPPPPLDTIPVDSAAVAPLAGIYPDERIRAPLRVDGSLGSRLRRLPGG